MLIAILMLTPSTLAAPKLANEPSLEAGDDWFCATTKKGRWCWGGADGLVARRMDEAPTEAFAESSVTRPLFVDVGRHGYGCTLSKGSVACGYYDPDEEVAVPPATHVAVGRVGRDPLACAITRDKKVWCWGSTRSHAVFAQDHPVSWERLDKEMDPREAPAHRGASDLAIDDEGRICSVAGSVIRCTGPYTTFTARKVPVSGIVAISDAFAALDGKGRVYAWNTYERVLPGPVELPGPAVTSVTGTHGVTEGGKVYYASRKLEWQLADFVVDPGDRLVRGSAFPAVHKPDGRLFVHWDPVQSERRWTEREPARGWRDVVGGDWACGLNDAGLSCLTKEPGSSIIDARPIPHTADIVAFANQSSTQRCFVRDEGPVYCQERAGNVEVPIHGVTQLFSAATSYCGVASGEVYCWGFGMNGSARQWEPRHVEGLTDVVDIAMKNDAACALDTSGDVHCWGNALEGAFGDGTGIDQATPITFLPER